MDRSKNILAWTEQGYTLFAEEGQDGIHVERLARMLNLNKSGFYHYFGDMEGYDNELLSLHKLKAELYFSEISHIKTIDPEWFHVLLQFKVPTMFQLQLLRCKRNPTFYRIAEAIDQKEDEFLEELWTEYLGLSDNPGLALRYLTIVRDMFYTRATPQNITYEFLRNLFTESKMLAQQIAESHTAAS